MKTSMPTLFEDQPQPLTVREDKVKMLNAHPHYRDMSDAEVIALAEKIPGMQRKGKVILPITNRAFAVACLMGTHNLL